jgi:hypothetical protein
MERRLSLGLRLIVLNVVICQPLPLFKIIASLRLRRLFTGFSIQRRLRIRLKKALRTKFARLESCQRFPSKKRPARGPNLIAPDEHTGSQLKPGHHRLLATLTRDQVKAT